MNELGTYLLELRTRQNYSLNFIKKHTGVTDSQLFRIEHGQIAGVSPTTLKKLSDFYQVGIIELYKLAGFINDKDLEQYSRVFSYAELLSEEQKFHIQEEINLFTGKTTIKEIK